MNAPAQNLEDYKWKNRIVFLVDDSFESEALIQQHELFQNEQNSMSERDLILFLTDGINVKSSTGEKADIIIENLRNTARISSDFKGVLLLGKDGGCKLKKDFPVEPKEIFALIDKMPMRHFERMNRLKIK